MSILVTGASGFVGTNLIPKLKTHCNVFTPTIDLMNLLDINAVERYFDVIRPTKVIHLAATVGGIGANKDNPGKFMGENLTMGLNVINTALKFKVKQFIMLGTVCAYPKYTPVPFKEEDIWNGYPEETNAPYGIAKKTLMELISAYNRQYNFNGTNLVPTNMYGPHDNFNPETSHVIPAIILKVYKAIIKGENKITIWGSGQASREFLYVDDLVHAVNLTLKAQLPLETDLPPLPINIGSGCEIKICDLVEKICSLMNFDGNVVYDTSMPDGQPRRWLNIDRAKRLLGYEPQTSLDEGLQKTLDWFYENYKL